MLIKDLIKKLEELYSGFDDEYKSVMGEPEIMIDVFRPTFNHSADHKYRYGGFCPDIIIEKTNDGVYDILSAFSETYDELRSKSPV